MVEGILYRLGVLLVVCLMCFFGGMGVGAHCMERKLQQDQLDLLRHSREIEQTMIQERDDIVREYTQKLREMEDRYAADIESIRNAQLSDTVPVPDCVQPEPQSNRDKGLPAKPANQSGITCYTEKQLRAKIEDSLAIARECDKEMMRFQALIEACGKR